ncbi:MAG: 4Fe-4S binding protein [candidate division NC10 bacterium]|nr:4Fe-4S binding protein [candidate division NC10 bacterium]
MDRIYEQLAAKLDEFPHGFPRTESGVELRILEKIFAPDEAAMAVRLLPIPEPVKTIAHRLGRPAEELRSILDRMVRRGQILSFRLRGETVYGLAPFVVGIYEFQLPRMDAELATLVEEYAPHIAGTVGGAKPALARVIPVSARIDAAVVILPYEDVRGMLAGARSFRLMDCICRTGQAKLGKPCSHPLETCMAFSTRENAYEGTPVTDYGRTVTREEALAVLDLSERDGLVHCTYNVQRESMFVCNCCTCCCGFLRGVKEFGAPHLLVRSNWVSAIEAGRCTACGACAGGRCPMDAITERDGRYTVSEARCIGCGVCTIGCPADAIMLKSRPRLEQTTPPGTIVTWAFARAVQRRGALRAALQFGGLAITTIWARLTASISSSSVYRRF